MAAQQSASSLPVLPGARQMSRARTTGALTKRRARHARSAVSLPSGGRRERKLSVVSTGPVAHAIAVSTLRHTLTEVEGHLEESKDTIELQRAEIARLREGVSAAVAAEVGPPRPDSRAGSRGDTTATEEGSVDGSAWSYAGVGDEEEEEEVGSEEGDDYDDDNTEIFPDDDESFHTPDGVPELHLESVEGDDGSAVGESTSATAKQLHTIGEEREG